MVNKPIYASWIDFITQQWLRYQEKWDEGMALFVNVLNDAMKTSKLECGDKKKLEKYDD
jgi:hypothetical protein